MTFMRKFLNLLKMKNQSIENNLFVNSPIHNKSALKEIRAFWKLHPQIYQNYMPEASSEAYFFYAKVLILYAFERCRPIHKSYPVYFMTECKVSNPHKFEDQLICEGFIGRPSIQEVLNLYKMPELKIIADKIGCKKNGRKAELIERIISSADSTLLQSYLDNCESYTLTAKGRDFLEGNYDFVELHQHHYSISLAEFYANRYMNGQKRSFNENSFSIIYHRVKNNCNKYNYCMVASDFKNLCEIALAMNMYVDATIFYLKAIYLDTCCTHEAPYYVRDNGITLEFSTELFNSIIAFTVHTAPQMVKLDKYYSPEFVDAIYKDASLPPSFLTSDEFKNAIKEMLNEIIFDYEKYNNIIRKRFKNYAQLK